MRYRTWILIIVLVLLVVALFLLGYLYFSLSRVAMRAPKVEVKGVEHVLSIYGYGKKPEELFKSVTGVAADKSGRIFVADTPNQRVLVFDKKGKFLGQLGTVGTAAGQFQRPEGLDAGPSGNIYVSDPNRNVVLVFGSDLNFKAEIVNEERPLAVYDTGAKIYVAGFDHLSVYDENLKLVGRWGTRGKQIGQFDFPHGVVALRNGNVVVSDGNNMRLVAYRDDSNRSAWVVGRPPVSMTEKERAFGLPSGMALDSQENIYVADPLRNTIHVYNSKGKKLAEYGEEGSADGQFSFPTDIAHLGGNTFVISDTMNNRLQIVKITLPR